MGVVCAGVWRMMGDRVAMGQYRRGARAWGSIQSLGVHVGTCRGW